MTDEQGPYEGAEDMLETARLYHSTGRVEAAEDLYWQILATDPAHPEPYQQLGLVALQAGKMAAARELLQTAVTLNPEEPRYQANLGAAYYASGDLGAAEAAYQAAVTAAPAYYEAWLNLGLVRRQSADWAGMAEALEQAVASNDTWEVMARQAAPFVYLAEARLRTGDQEGADAMAQAGYNLGVTEPDLQDVLVRLMVELNRAGEAIRLSQAMVQADPADYWGYLRLASACILADSLDEAGQALDQAYRLAPGEPDVHGAMARYHAALGETAEARQWLARALAVRPGDEALQALQAELA